MSNDFSFDDFEKEMLELAKDFKDGKEVDKFLKSEARKLSQLQKEQVIIGTNKQTGVLTKKKYYKIGKIYEYDGAKSIRAYVKAPHAHLIDKGHRLVKNGQEIGYVKGINFMGKAEKEFESGHFERTKAWIDKLIDKGL